MDSTERSFDSAIQNDSKESIQENEFSCSLNILQETQMLESHNGQIQSWYKQSSVEEHALSLVNHLFDHLLLIFSVPFWWQACMTLLLTYVHVLFTGWFISNGISLTISEKI